MSELDTIDFLCSSCSCKLQVPAAMAGVSGPCPNCNSSITAPLPAAAVLPATPPVALLTPPAEITTLPPKRQPEHIPATKIRATAHLIRQSTQPEEPVNKPEIKCRGFILEASAPELSHEQRSAKQTTFIQICCSFRFCRSCQRRCIGEFCT